MSFFANETDANFYNLIHQLVDSSQPDEDAERRNQHRELFLSTQRIALRRGPGIPDESEFIDVRCHDLTRKGFSFFLSSSPNFDSLVAAFGSPPELIYVAAKVSHCQEVLVYSSGVVEPVRDPAEHVGHQATEGQTATEMVLVGCRFTARLYR